MAIGEAKPLNRDERTQFYLATMLGAVVHRSTSDGGDGAPLYNINNAADNAVIATAVPYETVVAFTNGQALPAAPPVTGTLPEAPAPPAEAILNPIDDLTAAVAALVAGFAQLDAAVQAELGVLTTRLAGITSERRAMQQRAVNIGHITRTMAKDAQRLGASELPGSPGQK